MYTVSRNYWTETGPALTDNQLLPLQTMKEMFEMEIEQYKCELEAMAARTIDKKLSRPQQREEPEIKCVNATAQHTVKDTQPTVKDTQLTEDGGEGESLAGVGSVQVEQWNRDLEEALPQVEKVRSEFPKSKKGVFLHSSTLLSVRVD